MGEAAADVKQTYTLTDLKANTTEKSCYLLIDEKVYNVTEFLDEHPGGYDIILNTTGRDATEDFEEIGHSNAAREMLDKYLVGNFEGQATAAAAVKDTAKSAAASAASALPDTQQDSMFATIFKALLPLLIIAAAAYFALGKKS